jgi:hypothetical protein
MPEHARAVRTRTAPVYPRRVSGPARRPALAGVPSHRGRTSAFEKLSRIPDHRVVDRLLRGRACILLIGLMLGGIVAMQVSLLRLNAGISRAVKTQTTLDRQNMALQASIAELTSGERVRAAAVTLNMVDPRAGDTKYLRARPGKDEKYAVKRMKPAGALEKAIMANGGIVPGSLAEPGTTAAAYASQLSGQPVAGTTTTPAPTATPVATATPIATPVATATPIATPVATATPIPTPVTTVPETAPQG